MKNLLSAILIAVPLSGCAGDINRATQPVALQHAETGQIKTCQGQWGMGGLIGAQMEKNKCIEQMQNAGYALVESAPDDVYLENVDWKATIERDDFEGTSTVWIDKEEIIRKAGLAHYASLMNGHKSIAHYTKFAIVVDEKTGVPAFQVNARMYAVTGFRITEAAYGSGDNRADIKTVDHDIDCRNRQCVTQHEVLFRVSEDFVRQIAEGQDKTIRLYTTAGTHDVGLNMETVVKVYALYQEEFGRKKLAASGSCFELIQPGNAWPEGC